MTAENQKLFKTSLSSLRLMKRSSGGAEFEAQETRIRKLSRELEALKAERDKQNSEALKWAEKRDLLHQEIRKTRSEVERLRKERDDRNAEVRRLKDMREEAKSSYSAKIEELKTEKQRIREVSVHKPRRSSQSLEEEIKEIEWKIQTESLSLDDERRLVDQVKNLEIQMEVYRQIRKAEVKIEALRKEAAALKHETLGLSERISETAKQSQDFHEKMVEKLEKTRALKAEADEMHRVYIEVKEKAKPFHMKYVQTLAEVEALREAIQREEEAERAKRQDGLREKLEKGALEKLRRGGKLTFEEFKLLAEQGKI